MAGKNHYGISVISYQEISGGPGFPEEGGSPYFTNFEEKHIKSRKAWIKGGCAIQRCSINPSMEMDNQLNVEFETAIFAPNKTLQ